MSDRREHLGCPDIGTAKHTYLAVGVRQSRSPFDRIVAIVRFVLEGIPLPIGAIATTNVLDDDDVAPSCGLETEASGLALVVRSALQ